MTHRLFRKPVATGLTLWALGLLSGLTIAMPVSAQTVQIADAADLAAALEAGAGGAVLELAPGEYGALALRGTRAPVPAVIRSADPDNPAIFSGLDLSSFDGLVLENLYLRYRFATGDAGNLAPFSARSCTGFVLRGTRIEGDLARGTGEAGDGFPSATGFSVRGCNDVTLEGNTVTTFMRGLVLREIEGMVIAQNELTALRMDGMTFAQVADVRIEGNLIHNFARSLETGDHSDMIQFWTAGTQWPSHDIIIRSNTLNSGAGIYTQSIFMRNELADRAGGTDQSLFYRNILVENNLILNAHLHGISVGETIGLTIRNNTLIQNAGSADGDPNSGVAMPTIRPDADSVDVVVLDNITHDVANQAGQPDWRIARNLFIQNVGRLADRPGVHYSLIFANGGQLGDPGLLETWVLRPDGMGNQPGLGSNLLPR